MISKLKSGKSSFLWNVLWKHVNMARAVRKITNNWWSPQFQLPWVQHIGSTQKGHSFSASKIPQFNTENPSDQHTPHFHTPSVLHTPQFHTPLGSTPPSDFFKVILGVILWCWTEGFLVLKWGILGAEKVWSLCGIDVLNWGSFGWTEGYSLSIIEIIDRDFCWKCIIRMKYWHYEPLSAFFSKPIQGIQAIQNRYSRARKKHSLVLNFRLTRSDIVIT